jgi:site-specific recombinase XerC
VFGTGELVSLQPEDIDFESQRIHVQHGKGNRQRVVRFGTKAKEAVEVWGGKTPSVSVGVDASSWLGQRWGTKFSWRPGLDDVPFAPLLCPAR